MPTEFLTTDRRDLRVTHIWPGVNIMIIEYKGVQECINDKPPRLFYPS